MDDEGDDPHITSFSDLNYDCKLAVFSHLSAVEVARYLCVCKEWNEIGTTNCLWKQYYEDDFRLPSTYDTQRFESDYRHMFKHRVGLDERWISGKYTTVSARVHLNSVRGVAFSPVSPFLFASCGYDSRAYIFDVRKFPKPEKTFKKFTRQNHGTETRNGFSIEDWERLSRVKWTCDGAKLVVTSSSYGSVYIFDVEGPSSPPSKIFENVSSVRLDRTALAPHPRFPYLIAVAGRDNGDLALLDTRVPDGLIRTFKQLHKNTIRDVEWVGDDVLLTASPDATAKLTKLDGTSLLSITTTYSAAIWGNSYDGILSATKRENTVTLGFSGCMEVWDLANPMGPVESIPVLNEGLPIWRLKYNQRGTLLFIADDDGFVKLYQRRREGDSIVHKLVERVLTHDADVSDCDLSINEEYLVSASKSHEVGLASLLP